MKYYMLVPDDKLNNLPLMRDWNLAVNESKLHPGMYRQVSEKVMIYVKHDDNIFFPSIIVSPLFLMDTEVKKLYKMYEPNVQYKVVFLMDKENGKNRYYSIPFLDEIECLSSKSKLNQDKSQVDQLVLKRERIPKDTPLFMVAGLKNRCIVARMDFLESILRVNATGFKLKQVQMEEN